MLFQTNSTTEQAQPFQEGLSGQGYLSLLVFICFIFIIIILMMKAGRRVVIRVFSIQKIGSRDQMNERVNKRITLGVLKHKEFSTKERCWIYWIRHRGKTRRYKSNTSMDDFKEIHCPDTTYKILFLLNANVFKTPLKPEDYYKTELGWTTSAIFNKGLVFCFSGGTGVLGIFMMAILFLVCLQAVIGVLIGAGVGFVLTIFCTVFIKLEIIDEKAFKKKEVEIMDELRLVPLNSPIELCDVYAVKGTVRRLVDDSDFSKGYKSLPLEHKASKTEYSQLTKKYRRKLRQIQRKQRIKLYKKLRKEIPPDILSLTKNKLLKLMNNYKIPNEKNPKTDKFPLKDEIIILIVSKIFRLVKELISDKFSKKIAKYENYLLKLTESKAAYKKSKYSIERLKQPKMDEDGNIILKNNRPLILNWIKVEGYQELYDMRKSKLYNIKSWKLIGLIERKRSNEEMQMLMREYLSKNRSICEENLLLKKQVEELTEKSKLKDIEILHVLGDTAQSVSNMGAEATKQMTFVNMVLPKIYKQIMGKRFTGAKFAKVHEAVMKEIQKAEMDDMFTKDDIEKLLKNLIDKNTIDKEKINALLSNKMQIDQIIRGNNHGAK